MIVIMLSDCPPKVRGDLSKWLCEINTGVFVGNVSSRVREEVWQRICENIKSTPNNNNCLRRFLLRSQEKPNPIKKGPTL